jgi:uncharacterized damage-inducible protein DinB
VADPTIEGAHELLSESLDELHKAVRGCSADELNRRPAGEHTNGLAVILTHALHSTRSWLSLAIGADLPHRDRPAEFRVVVDDADAFRASAEAVGAECLALLDAAGPFEPGRTGVPTWRFDEHDEGDNAPVTAAWALLHALLHLGEHVGHAHITRQLLDDRG